MEKTFNFNLPATVVDTVLASLAEMPLKNTFAAFMTIRQQVDTQNTPSGVAESVPSEPQLLRD